TDRPGHAGSTTLALFNSSRLPVGPDRLHGSVAVAIFGNITGNLSSRLLPLGETRITLSTIFGSAKLVVPPGVASKVTGLSLFRGVKIRGRGICDGILKVNDYEPPGYAQAGRRLHVDATAIFGGLRIK